MNASRSPTTNERTTPQHAQHDQNIRETYEEFDLQTGNVAMISDPQNPHAWVQSDATIDIRQ